MRLILSSDFSRRRIKASSIESSSASTSSKHISHLGFLVGYVRHFLSLYPLLSNTNTRTPTQVLGKAMYEGILIEPRFALHFLNKLLGNENHFDEMRLLDKDVYKNLLFVKEFEGDFEDLGLCFDVTTSKALGTSHYCSSRIT